MTLFFRGCFGQAHEILNKLISLGGIVKDDRLVAYGCIDASRYYFIGADNLINSVSMYSIAAYNNGSRLFINWFDDFKKVCPYNVGDFVKIRNFLDIKYEITKVIVNNLDEIYYYLDNNNDDVAWVAEDLEKD